MGQTAPPKDQNEISVCLCQFAKQLFVSHSTAKGRFYRLGRFGFGASVRLLINGFLKAGAADGFAFLSAAKRTLTVRPPMLTPLSAPIALCAPASSSIV